MRATEEAAETGRNQPRTRTGVKDLPNRLSRRNRTRVLELESTYRNRLVKHEPETHTKGGVKAGVKPLP